MKNDWTSRVTLVTALFAIAFVLVAGVSSEWLDQTPDNHDAWRTAPVRYVPCTDDGDGTCTPVESGRPVQCTIRGTLALAAQSSPNTLDASCPDDSVTDQFHRVILRGMNLVDSTTGLCLSFDGGTNYVTVDGEAPIYDTKGQDVTKVIISNNGSDCVIGEVAARSYTVVIE